MKEGACTWPHSTISLSQGTQAVSRIACRVERSVGGENNVLGRVSKKSETPSGLFSFGQDPSRRKTVWRPSERGNGDGGGGDLISN